VRVRGRGEGKSGDEREGAAAGEAHLVTGSAATHRSRLIVGVGPAEAG
jgi:hypothetical protein